MNNLKSILFGFWVQDFSGFLDVFFFGGGTDFTRRYDMILDNCRSRESSQRLIKNASQSFSDDENGSSFQAPRSTLINIFMIADTYRYTYLYIYIYTQNGKNMYIYIHFYMYLFSFQEFRGWSSRIHPKAAKQTASFRSKHRLFFSLLQPPGSLRNPWRP